MTSEPAILTRYIALTADFGEQFDRPCAWLTRAEQGELARFHHPLRRRQWLVGRWLAKQLIGEMSGNFHAGDVQILTRDGRGLGARPVVSVCGETLDGSLSISHTQRGVLIAWTASEWSIGVDLASDVPSDERFERLWFTASERCWIGGEAARAALVWSLKEAVYKACQSGQGWSPRLVEVSASADGGFACSFSGTIVEGLQLTIEQVDSQIAVIAAVPDRVESIEDNNAELVLAECS